MRIPLLEAAVLGGVVRFAGAGCPRCDAVGAHLARLETGA